MKSICVFGDSTAWGAWDMEKGGWVNRLWLYIGEKTDGECEVYNLSISGGTTEKIIERFESEAQIREADALIFQSGGNDSYLKGKNGSNQISIDQFRNDNDFEDGLHSNAIGHQKIFVKVKDFLEENKWI